MAIQTINIGNVVNDGLGDDLRTAFEKVNANFTEISAALTVTGSNLGTTGEGVFAQKDGADLQFKRLLGGIKTTLTSSATSITINSTQPDAFTTVVTQSGSVNATDDGLNITLQGGNDVETVASGSVITVDTILPLDEILNRFDFGPLDGDIEYPTQLSLATANADFGRIVFDPITGEEASSSNLNLDLGTLAGA